MWSDRNLRFDHLAADDESSAERVRAVILRPRACSRKRKCDRLEPGGRSQSAGGVDFGDVKFRSSKVSLPGLARGQAGPEPVNKTAPESQE